MPRITIPMRYFHLSPEFGSCGLGMSVPVIVYNCSYGNGYTGGDSLTIVICGFITVTSRTAAMPKCDVRMMLAMRNVTIEPNRG